MNFIRRYGKYFSLSVFAIFLPFVLLFFAGIVDYIYDRGTPLAVLIRFLPVHIVLIALVSWTLRITRNEAFESS